MKARLDFGSIEEAFIGFCEHAPGPVPARRAYEDRVTFFAGAIAGINLIRSGRGDAADRDIAALGKQLAARAAEDDEAAG